MKSANPIIAITLLLLLPTSAAFAQKGENSWLNSSGGDFDVPSNWSQNVVPGSFEAAVFDLGATLEYEVFGTDVDVGELIFGRDDVTLRLPGSGAGLDAGSLFIGGRSTNTALRPGSLRIELLADASSFLNTIEVGKTGFASRLELSPPTRIGTSFLDIRTASTLRLDIDALSGGFVPMIQCKGSASLLGTLEVRPDDDATLPPLGTTIPLIEVLGGFSSTFSTIVTSGEPGRRIDPMFESFGGFGAPQLLLGVVVAEDTTNVPDEIDDLGIGAATFAIEATDLSGDGLDEIVIATDAGKLSIYSPVAGGGFSGPFDYALGTSPTDIASGDYDGDGTNDLAISNFGDDDLTILLNPASNPSALQTAANLAVDSGPSAVLTTDLGTAGSSNFLFADGDDLVVVSRSSGTATGYRSEGGGLFVKTADVQVGDEPGPSAPIDDENKKDPDAPLGVGGRTTAIQGAAATGILSIVQPNPATGGLDVTATVALSGLPVGVAAADLDGDGAAESIVATDLGTLDVISGTTSFSRSTIPLPPLRTATTITAGRFDSEPGSEIVVGVVDSDGTGPALLVYRPRISSGLSVILLDLINEIPLDTAPTALALGIGETSTSFTGLPDQPTLSVGGGAGSGETPEVTLLGLVTTDVPECNKADFNGDGKVSGADLSFILSYWGPCGTVCATDLNQDGFTDSADLGLFLGFWGPCVVP
jgi:hypothetical protein